MTKEINITKGKLDELQKENIELKNEFNNKDNEIKDINNDLAKIKQNIEKYSLEITKEKNIFDDSNNIIKDFESKIQQSKVEIDKIILKNKNDEISEKQSLNILKKNFQNQKEKNQNELLIMKQNIENKVKNEYENKITNKIKILAKEILDKIKNKENELKENLKKKFENSDILFEEQFMQTINIEKSKLEEIHKMSQIKNEFNFIHYNIPCKLCMKNPIIGFRYKCSQCPNFNICSICEEKNAINNNHPHYFIKIRKAEYDEHSDTHINDYFINENFINNQPINIENENQLNYYSYKCLNNQLTTEVFEGDEKTSIQITLKNNGTQPWINYKTILKYNKNNSNIRGSNIILKPQLPGSQNNYDIKFNDLKKYSKGIYKASYHFTINDNVYGNELVFYVTIKEKENSN